MDTHYDDNLQHEDAWVDGIALTFCERKIGSSARQRMAEICASWDSMRGCRGVRGGLQEGGEEGERLQQEKKHEHHAGDLLYF